MFSLKKMAAAAACIALPVGGAVLAAAPAAQAAAPTSFVSLSYGPHGVASHYLALDVYGQNHANGTPVVAWESDEYQNVSGAVDPAEQFVKVPVTYGATSADATVGGAPATNGYQLEWAPGDVLSGKCVEDQSTAEHTWARIYPCATGTYSEESTVLTGSASQDFFLDSSALHGTSTLASHGYGQLETAVGGLSGAAPTFTSGVALNDSAYVNGGHVISWRAISETNEEFRFRTAS